VGDAVFGSVVLELFIGMAFLFLVLSLVVTTAQELIAGVLGMRAGNLQVALRKLLFDPQGTLVAEVMNHPTMRRLYRGTPGSFLGIFGNGPSYVPNSTFATALLDVIREKHMEGKAQPISQEDLFAMAPDVVRRMPDGDLKHALTLLVGQFSDGDRPIHRRMDQIETRVGQWFDETMDRASGWYKRKSQAIGLVLASGLVVLINADALTFMETLWRDASLREALVKAAEASVNADEPLKPEVEGLLTQLGLFPLGWPDGVTLASRFASLEVALRAVAGWGVTVLAVSLGAAFWFDLTKKALSLRASGPKPANSNAG
jgi:hypothetical protein